MAQSGIAKTYGTFTIDAAGAWTYTLDDDNGTVQALNAGGTLHELVTVSTADGTTRQIDITINGANDAAVIIETFGATDLVQVGNQFFLRDGGGVGPSLKDAGVAYTDGQFGAWTPVGGGADRRGAIRWPGSSARRPVHRVEHRRQRQLDELLCDGQWCRGPTWRCSCWRRRSSRI